ncbi:MAG: AAA family ATPase [Promethearchaeota archaeon]
MPLSKSTKSNIDSDESNLEPNNSDFYEIHSLQDEIRALKQQGKRIMRKSLALEMELQSALADRDMYRRKYLDGQTKITQLASNPLIVGFVEKILIESDQSRALVRLASNQMFVCQFDPNILIEEGDTVALHQKSMAIIEVLPSLVEPYLAAMELQDILHESYGDIGGLDEELMQIREVVELSLKEPELFEKFNITPPHGILMYGQPGTGKTLVAKAVANACNAKFYNIAAPELVQKYIGEGARMIREIFNSARNCDDPVIIFIDEIDSIATKRTSESQSGEREVNRTLMQLLAEMDGFSSNDRVRIIAATNRLDILDPAILRPGRFDRLIELPMPNDASRMAIFKIHLKNTPKYGIKYEKLAKLTEGFSGADIKAVCMEGSMRALRDQLEGKTRKKVTQIDFELAIAQYKDRRGNSSFFTSSQKISPLYS